MVSVHFFSALMVLMSERAADDRSCTRELIIVCVHIVMGAVLPFLLALLARRRPWSLAFGACIFGVLLAQWWPEEVVFPERRILESVAGSSREEIIKLSEHAQNIQAPVVLRQVLTRSDLDFFHHDNLASLVKEDTEVDTQLGYPEQQETVFMTRNFQSYLSNLSSVNITEKAEYLNEAMGAFNDLPEVTRQIAEVFRRAGLVGADCVEDIESFTYVCNSGERGAILNVFFAGTAGAKTGLHADPDRRNVLLQFQGNKTITVFHPWDREFLYVGSKFDNGALVSKVDPFHPDLQAFPLFKSATPLTVHLQPGDAIYLPRFWFHYVQTLGSSVSMGGRRWTLKEMQSQLPLFIKVGIHGLGLWPGESTGNSDILTKLMNTFGISQRT